MIISFSHLKKQFCVKTKMKRRLALLSFISLVLAFSACDSVPDGVVDNKFVDYKLTRIVSPSNFTYSSPDSILKIFLGIQKAGSVSDAWLSIKSYDGTNYVENQRYFKKMMTEGVETSYYAEVPMSKKVSSGKYLVEFFVSDNIHVSPDNVSKVGEQVLVYDNNQTKYAPVISNLVLVDKVTRDTPFTFTVKVDDQNGPGDIAQVTFKLTRPDGTVVIPNPNTPNINYFLMVDNGDSVLGDAKAGDGIYSFKNTFGPTAQTGNWQFEFQAKDKSGEVSNVIKQILGVN